MEAPVDLVAVRGARETIRATLQAHPELGARTGAFFAGELQEGPMAEDKMTRIRADLVERAGEVRDKLNEEATAPWRVTQKAILEDAIRIGLDAIERRPPAEPPALTPAPKPAAKPTAPKAPRKTPEPDPDDPASALLRAYGGRKPSRRSKPATRAGRLLRQWREGNGLSQVQAAARIGKTQVQWGRYERGESTPLAGTRAELETLVEDLQPDDWTTPNQAAE